MNADLRFAAAVDKGADRVVGSGPTDVQLRAVPRLNQADEVGALVLETPEEKKGQMFFDCFFLLFIWQGIKKTWDNEQFSNADGT